MTYTLKISKEQAQAISNCTELYARIQMGQVEDVGYQLLANTKYLDLPPEDQSAIRDLLSDIHRILVGATNTSFGLHNKKIPEQARVAWDIHQVVRNVLAWERQPEGGISSVAFDKPYKTAGVELATMEKQEASE